MNVSKQKNWLTAAIVSIFFGVFGVDRFYLGYYGLGVLKFLTFGGVGVWAVIDTIRIIENKLPDAYGNLPYKNQPDIELVNEGLVSKKEWINALLYSVFLGMLGVDRFYVGHKLYGIIKLFIFCIVTVFSIRQLITIIYLFESYLLGSYNMFDLNLDMLEVPSWVMMLNVLLTILWIADIIFFCMNKVNDSEGKKLWK